MNIQKFWEAVLQQDADEIRKFFHPNAYVNWHNTNEHFTVEEFIQSNCQYPGQWDGEIQQIVEAGDMIVTATHVHSKDGKISCHATSFIRIKDDKILSVEEYWGDDGEAPRWRQDMQIGTPIRGER